MAIVHIDRRRSPALGFGGISLALVAAFALYRVVPDGDATHDTDGRAPAAARDCDADVRCTATRVVAQATAACATPIEQLAAFGARWTGAGSAAPTFDRFTWLGAAGGPITFAGDAAEFRNGADAPVPIAYECDFDPARAAVLGVRARPRPMTAPPGAPRPR